MNIISILELADLEVVKSISYKEANEYNILPLYSKDEEVYVLTSSCEPLGEELINFIYKKRIHPINCSKEILKYLIQLLLNYDVREIGEKIIEEAIESKASDIHFEPVGKELKVRMRINGTLVLKRIILLGEYNHILSKFKINSNMDITEKRKPQDGKMNFLYNKTNYNLRLSTIPIIHGEKLVIRILYEDKYLGNLENLNFSINQLEKLRKIISIKNGLVLITGPTGVGKSTTLYSILNSVEKKSLNITTLEDPIEITLRGINQINLNPKIGITFAAGLRSILRQDPDVIMLGEVRDEETAQMAVRAAITGHKVYSTIHTKSPREVYLRLEEMGVKPYLIRDSLCGIISQRLIKVLCDNCKYKIKIINYKNKEISIYKHSGCSKCNGTGYVGRKLVASVNYINKDIVDKINDNEIKDDTLTNNEMLQVLEDLLLSEVIDYYDLLTFIEGEELGESQLQQFRSYL